MWQTVPKFLLATASFTRTLLGDSAIWKDEAISGIWWPRFWLWLFTSLFCDCLSPSLVFWSAGRGGGVCCGFFSSWYSLLGSIKQHRLLCSYLLSATGTVECPRAAGSQAPWQAHSSAKPSHCWCKSQHCTSDLGRAARETCHPSGLTQGTHTELLWIARNGLFLL